MPALPLDEAGKYVAAAYIAFAVLLMVYVGIMAARLTRIQREIAELASGASMKREEGRSIGERIAPAPAGASAQRGSDDSESPGGSRPSLGAADESEQARITGRKLPGSSPGSNS